MKFEEYLEKQTEKVLSSWEDENIYAISFLLTANELSSYKGIDFFPEFSVGYNTEADCEGVPAFSEERWNYAFWSQNNIPVISPDNEEGSDLLLDWYKEQNVTDIGTDENEDEMFDENMNYIGKGPHGYIELLNLITEMARKIQLKGDIKKKFGNIPIIIHDDEYSWYTIEATKNANPDGEADDFLNYTKNCM